MSETTELTTGVESYVLRGDQWHRVREDGTLGSRVAQYAGPDLVDALDALAAARREVEAVTQRAIQAEADLATSRAAQEGVRRVEAWIQAGNAPDLPEHSIAGLVNARYGAIVRWEDEETTVATGDSLEALGRALAQEAGDGR